MFDPETGLYHYKARALHPTLGRFLQRDLPDALSGPAPYEYAAGLPVLFADPQGEHWVARETFRNVSGAVQVVCMQRQGSQDTDLLKAAVCFLSHIQYQYPSGAETLDEAGLLDAFRFGDLYWTVQALPDHGKTIRYSRPFRHRHIYISGSHRPSTTGLPADNVFIQFVATLAHEWQHYRTNSFNETIPTLISEGIDILASELMRWQVGYCCNDRPEPTNAGFVTLATAGHMTMLQWSFCVCGWHPDTHCPCPPANLQITEQPGLISEARAAVPTSAPSTTAPS